MNDDIKTKVEARIKEEQASLAKNSPKDEADGRLSDLQLMACAGERRAGDAAVYISVNRDKLVYVHRWGTWLRWADHFWIEDINSQDALAAVENVVDEYRRVISLLRKQLDEGVGDDKTVKRINSQIEILSKKVSELRDVNGRRNTLEFVRTGRDKSMAIDGDELDQKPWLLACANGVIDLKTGELRPGRQGDFITCAVPTKWEGLETHCPEFEKFMSSILGEDKEMVDYMRRMLGHALIGYQREHVFLVLSGSKGRNGKDTLMKIISEVLGRDMVAPMQSEMLLDQGYAKSSSGPAPDVLSLKGHRIAYASETEDGRRFSTSKVKLLSGGGEMVARGAYSIHQCYWKPTHTLILMTNDMPHAKADDQAFFTRLHLVQFKYSFLPKPNPNNEFEKQADPDLAEKLSAEASGILAWLVRGCLEYQKEGLNPPLQVTESTQAYRNAEDVVGQFIAECCQVKDGLEIQASDLYDAFNFWYSQEVSRKGAFSNKKFGELLDKKGFVKKKKSTNFWQGLTVTEAFAVERAKVEKGDNQDANSRLY